MKVDTTEKLDKLLKLTDDMASKGEFITFKDIFEAYCDHPIKAVTKETGYEKLKQRLYREKTTKDFLEFRNGKDLSGGFKYKQGYEYYFRAKEEEHMKNKMDDDSLRLFLTDGLQALIDNKTASKHLIELETISELKNISLVKVLAKHLGKRVISFEYNQGYRKVMQITMHPHILKEFNSRWFLFGYVDDENKGEKVVNFSLDRIVYHSDNDIKKEVHREYKPCPSDFYKQYFKDIIGVTRLEGKEVETIFFRTTNFIVHNLLLTKPLHSSQKETMPFDEEKGEGEFTLRVIPNIELQTKLMSFSDGLYVVGDGEFQKRIRNAVANMYKRYQ